MAPVMTETKLCRDTPEGCSCDITFTFRGHKFWVNRRGREFDRLGWWVVRSGINLVLVGRLGE